MHALLSLLLPLALAPGLRVRQEPATETARIGGEPYERLATREATLDRMMALLRPHSARWGEWHLLSPFPFTGHGTGGLAAPQAPEQELAAMAAGGPGPDLAAVYAGKKGVEVRWAPLGRLDNRMVDLNVHGDPELDDEALCYLYAPVDSDAARVLELTCGSDDGLRVWWNGELLIDQDVERGIDPAGVSLRLPLQAGRNHFLAKVSEGKGSWAFQINSEEPLAPALDALLQYRLDRDFPPSPERAYWRVMTIPVPDASVLEVGGLAFLADGRPVVSTRRGDVWRVEGAYDEPPVDARLELFASGLHEPLGAAVRQDPDGEAVYAVQRGELTRLLDRDGDGRAEVYETVCDGWGVSGNYHEFAFGPEFDAEGNAWVTLNVGFCGGLGKSVVPWRGWALKITPAGEIVPVCDGLRSPNGMAAWNDGEMFYVDNQGDYVATNRLSRLAPGSWHGHPSSLRWRTDLDGPSERPPREPAAVWFPYRKMGQSAADIALDTTGGAFGPFAGQFFVGDQMMASVMRVNLEVVEGHYQGACFPFLEGLDSGVNRVAFAPDGSMFVGQTDRGWGSVGRRSWGLQRIVHTGLVPFEILAVRAQEDGFELELTQDADPVTAADPRSFAVKRFTYEYHAAYGAPEDDTAEVPVLEARLLGPRRVRLVLAQMRADYVHEIRSAGLRSAPPAAQASGSGAVETGGGGEPLLHDTAWYTLIRVPGRAAEDRAPELPRVLFLTHSAGFVHDVVKRPDPFVLSIAEERLTEAARGRFEIVATQDCAEIRPEVLEGLDAVVFFTTGELPIGAANRDALVDWVRRGGAFAGVHSAADTFYEYAPYQEMLGGVFDGHPWHQEVRVRVEAPDHRATAHLAPSSGAGGEGVFSITDEIYQYRDWRRHPQRVLLSLDTGSVDASKGKRADGDYALAWCRDWGAGRVFYTALGHEPKLWSDRRFLEHLLGGIEWAIDGPELSPPAPAGATALLDGSGLARWARRGGGEPGWREVDGAVEVVAGAGDLVSRESFGNALVHVEFCVPAMPEAKGQARGNSGVYLQGRYEVQVLDSWGLEPGLGDCGALYSKKAPDSNACRPPESWQSYDIAFTAPRFDAGGRKTANARVSVWQNGIPIHREVEVDGPTGGNADAEAPLGPLMLQDHGNPMRFRNAWVLPLR